MLRVYKKMGLVQRLKKEISKSGKEKPLYQLLSLNKIWSMDFMRGSFDDGRIFRFMFFTVLFYYRFFTRH